MAKIGYMRVSTCHQKFDSQEKALKEFGVDHLFKEYGSGRNTDRSELNKALACLAPGDTFVIFKLDRLSRTTRQLLFLIEEFEKRNIQFVSLQNHIDTSTPMGKFFFTIMGAFAEMEANLIRERVIAGIEAAREKGVPLGRPRQIKNALKAIDLYTTTNMSVKEIADKCHISIPTLYKYLREFNILKRTHSSTKE